MIELRNLKRFVNDSQTLALESGGEVENFLAKDLDVILQKNFGIVCEIEVKK